MKASGYIIRRVCWMIPVVIILLVSCANLSLQKPIESILEIACGDEMIELRSYTGSADSTFLFVNVHEDEQTSIEALRTFAIEHPINYLYLHHQGTRRIAFSVYDTSYTIDPNRMFTDVGRKKTLNDGGSWSESAQEATRLFSEQLLTQLKGAKTIVALHNNTPDRYSIQSYLPDSSEAQNTGKLFINPEMDPDDFIYTTDPVFFDHFKARNINVILQDNTNFIDDGSLSVHCGMHQISYVNIETEHGHLDEQIRLLSILLEAP